MVDCQSYFFEDDGSIPNNSRLPLLVYKQGLSENDIEASSCKQLLANHNWTGAWVNGIFDYHHYHSTAHEVLAVISGNATVKFGGPEGEELQVSERDVVVIPAGVGHCLISNSVDFRVIGAYPDGQSWDLCTGRPEERPQVLDNIKKVPLPKYDPVTGEKEPLFEYWKG